MSNGLSFNNGLNVDVNVFSDVNDLGERGIGPNNEYRVPRSPAAGVSGKLKFENYSATDKLRIIIRMDTLPDNGKFIGFKYAFGGRVNRNPKYIQVTKKTDMYELVVHYDRDNQKRAKNEGEKSQASSNTGAIVYGELEFLNYMPKKEVLIRARVDDFPDTNDAGFKYNFDSNLYRIPHHLEFIKKGDKFELIIHYKDEHVITDIDPQIKHPEGL